MNKRLIHRALMVPVAAAALIGAALPASAAISGPAAPASTSAAHAATAVKPKALSLRGNLPMRNQNTGRCIDDSQAYGLRAFPCNGLSYQGWHTISGHPGQFQNQNTGRCIDDSLRYGLRAYPCNDGSYNSGYQYWYISGISAGAVHLRNLKTGRCIDDSFAYGLRAFTCNGLNYQGWTF